MAPPTILAAVPPPPVDSADRISKLPKDIQEHILSFLPAQEAVRTCILSRTWRDVWKSTRRLLIRGDSVEEVREFVDGLLRVSGGASLDAIEFTFDPFENMDEDDERYYYGFDYDELSSLNRWIRCVMECQIQTLRVDVSTFNDYFEMDSEPLISCRLTRLELRGVKLFSLNLDGCPLLEHLEIHKCSLGDVRKIMSLSLKSLVITSCVTHGDCKRIRICVPRLVSLLLDDMKFRTPLLRRMPELMGATVNIDYSRHGCCHCDDPMNCYHVMQAIDTSDSDFDSNDEEDSEGYAGQNTTECVVLEGLAQAKDLVLIAHPSMYVFRRDLRCCPTFSNLKTLVLNDFWSGCTDCSALACMLQHAPVIEKLTVLFSRAIECKYDVVVEGRPGATRKSTMIPQHLKIVEVKCFEVHQRVLEVLRFLGTLNIWFLFIPTEGYR